MNFYRWEDLHESDDFTRHLASDAQREVRSLRTANRNVPSGLPPAIHIPLVAAKPSLWRRILDHPVLAMLMLVFLLFFVLSMKMGSERAAVAASIRSADPASYASKLPAVNKLAVMSPVHMSYSFLSPVGNVDDFCEQIQGDSRFQFDCYRRQEYTVRNQFTAFVAGWDGTKLFWSKRPRVVKVGTLIFTDGENSYLAICGNKISFTTQTPSRDVADGVLESPSTPTPDEAVTPQQLPPQMVSSGDVARVEEPARKRGGFAWWDVGIVAGGAAAAFRHNDSPSTWTPPPPQDCQLEIACK